VSWDATKNKWIARYKVRDQVFLAGRCDNEEDAARAYDDAVRKHLRSSLPLNFPTGAKASDKSASSGSKGLKTAGKTAQAKRSVPVPAPPSSGPAPRGGQSSQEGLVCSFDKAAAPSSLPAAHECAAGIAYGGGADVAVMRLAVQVPEAQRRRGPPAVGRDARPPHQAPRQTRARQPG
jgi:hypothetical protein